MESSMLSTLFRKWFGLPLVPACNTCDVLRDQLEESNRERRELLQKLLSRGESEPAPSISTEEMKPITPQFIPWRVKQQMMEQEDRKRAQLMRERAKEISDLEKELLPELKEEAVK